jgi:hypothetical protein
VVFGREAAEKRIKVVMPVTISPFSHFNLIEDSKTAINVIEPILFRMYGKEQILQQRPYELYLIDSLWYMAGTTSRDSKGGTFEVIMKANDGRVLSLIHTK